MTALNQARQGDVLLTRIEALPADATPAAPGTVPGRVVLAYGEATGHHHSLALADDRIALFRDTTGGAYLVVADGPPVALEHQEHSTITLPAGVYRMPTQVEYSPAELVRVAD
jgi:hypothetical protein